MENVQNRKKYGLLREQAVTEELRKRLQHCFQILLHYLTQSNQYFDQSTNKAIQKRCAFTLMPSYHKMDGTSGFCKTQWSRTMRRIVCVLSKTLFFLSPCLSSQELMFTFYIFLVSLSYVWGDAVNVTQTMKARLFGNSNDFFDKTISLVP